MSALDHTTTGDDDHLTVEVDELSWTESLGSNTEFVPHHITAAPRPRTGPASAHIADRLYRSVSDAHSNALDAHQALQMLLVKRWTAARPAGVPALSGPAPEPAEYFDIVGDRLLPGSGEPADRGSWPPRRTAFKPLARTRQTALDRRQLESMTRGDIATVLGPPYAQPGCNPRVALAASGPLVLTAVDRLDCANGPARHGALEARWRPAGTGAGGRARQYLTAARQAIEVMALQLGLHLCFADCALAEGAPEGAVDETRRTPTLQITAEGLGETLRAEVVSIDLLPLPWLAADIIFADAHGNVTARIRGLCVHARPRPGAPLGPSAGGAVPEFLGRFNGEGVPALLSEFNIANIAHGDQAIAMGPEFARFSDVPAVRLPSGELLFVDRVMSLTGRRGDVHGEARWRTEYDSPADAWYYRDSANAGMPNCVFMEFSLQAAAFLGPYLGGTLLGDGDEPLRLRNLEGRATLLHEVDLRGRTISQDSSITATSVSPGALLQEFAYESSLAGRPFYRGRSLFGYFDTDALNNQVGLDGGRRVPTWLETSPDAAVRTVDVARRRAAPSRVACSTGQLALIDTFDVVDSGGKAGLGYLHAVQEVDPAAWYFDRHFYLDPVIPGSFGVETIVQAIQEWAVDTGLDRPLDRPEFVVPAGSTLKWKYRGQFLRSDTPMTFEVHITGIERKPGRVRITAEASVWKPGMRIYWVEQVVVELREPDAPPW